jgi:hypothetical protein
VKDVGQSLRGAGCSSRCDILLDVYKNTELTAHVRMAWVSQGWLCRKMTTHITPYRRKEKMSVRGGQPTALFGRMPWGWWWGVERVCREPQSAPSFSCGRCNHNCPLRDEPQQFSMVTDYRHVSATKPFHIQDGGERFGSRSTRRMSLFQSCSFQHNPVLCRHSNCAVGTVQVVLGSSAPFFTPAFVKHGCCNAIQRGC